ncbi:MAG TPA: DUF4399 domain-containing protein [Gemmatimonadota bacterium]|nr:DUF4399 domain-containing protein [Gemmatimonadota bacterium]
MSHNPLPILVFAALTACSAETGASVRIEQPLDGALITADSVRIVLAASGIEIAQADGLDTPGRAHHHVFLDADLSAADQPIPAGQPGIVHLGTGVSEVTLTGLTPGRHRLIAVLALGNHVPLDPWAVDTVFITVQAPTE